MKIVHRWVALVALVAVVAVLLDGGARAASDDWARAALTSRPSAPIPVQALALPGVPEVWAVDETVGRVIVVTTPGYESGKHTITFLDGSTGRIIVSLPFSENSNYPNDLSVDRQRHHVLAVADGEIDTFDTRTGRQLHAAHVPSQPFSLAMDSASGRAYAGDMSGKNDMIVLDTRTGAIIKSVYFRPSVLGATEIDPIAVNKQGDVFLLTDQKPAIVNERGTILHHIPLSVGNVGAYDSRRDRAVLVGGSANLTTAYTIDGVDGRVETAAPIATNSEFFPASILILDSRSGRTVLEQLPSTKGSSGRFVHLFDDRTGRRTASMTIRTPDGIGESTSKDAAIINHDTGHVLLLLEEDPFTPPAYLQVLDGTTGHVLTTIRLDESSAYSLPSIAIDYRTHHLYISSSDTGSVSVFDSRCL